MKPEDRVREIAEKNIDRLYQEIFSAVEKALNPPKIKQQKKRPSTRKSRAL